MDIQRRRILTAAAALPALALATKGVHAGTAVSSEDVGVVPAAGSWAILEHVTDGTDPSTTVIAAPKFTPEMRKLVGKEVTLTGYLQPVAGGFGKSQTYLFSRNIFHCPYCYPLGRGSLALASFDGHVPSTGKRVTIKGILALQEKDPSDFYFQLKNSKIV